MSVYEKAEAGAYRTKLPWRSGPGHEEMRRAHNDDQSRLNAQFITDLEAEHGTAGHPKADRLFQLAWDRGHAYGHAEVASHYEDFAELLK